MHWPDVPNSHCKSYGQCLCAGADPECPVKCWFAPQAKDFLQFLGLKYSYNQNGGFKADREGVGASDP